MNSRPRPSLPFRERGLHSKGTCPGGGGDGTGSPLRWRWRATLYLGVENGLHRSEEGPVYVVGYQSLNEL